ASAARSELCRGARGMNQRHETSDMDPKYIAYFAAGLVVLGVLVHIGLWWMFHQFEEQQARRENRPTLVEAPRPTPQPKLQISPRRRARSASAVARSLKNGADQEKVFLTSTTPAAAFIEASPYRARASRASAFPSSAEEGSLLFVLWAIVLLLLGGTAFAQD